MPLEIRQWLIVAGIVAVCASPTCAAAANLYVAASGPWNSSSTWSASGCGLSGGASPPDGTSTVVLCPGQTVTVPCGVAASYLMMMDAPGDWSNGGGFVADASSCPRGQAPSLVSSATTRFQSVYLSAMGPAAVFKVQGRQEIASAQWGVPLDLTSDCGGADQVVNGVTWHTAKNECATYQWSTPPLPPGSPSQDLTTLLQTGDIIWFTSGMWRNNFVTVLAVTPTSLMIGYGDPNDDKGTAGGFTPSLQAARDVSVLGFDLSNPTRTRVTLAAGALPVPFGATSGTGQLQGSCLVTSNGNYYTIAGSIDGGSAPDTLVLDPWATVASADQSASFLSKSPNAWIAPCIHPGDGWMAFEPVRILPAAVGVNYTQMTMVNGLCPVFSYALQSQGAPGAPIQPPGNQPWSYLFDNMLNLYGQTNCTIAGPYAIGPSRTIGATDTGYGIGIMGTNGLTISHFSLQGFYAAASGRLHGTRILASRNLVIQDSNFSFIPQEGVYLAGGLEQDQTNPLTGVTMTVRRTTCHDTFQLPKDGADFATCISTGNSDDNVGPYQFTFDDNLAYNAGAYGILLVTGVPTANFHADVFNNVIAYPHRRNEDDTDIRYGIYCGNGAAYGNDLNANIVNNAILTSIDYAGQGSTIAIEGCSQVDYNYIGEAWIGLATNSPSPVLGLHWAGDVVDAAGASPTNTSSTAYAAYITRNSGSEGTVQVSNLVTRRLCSLLPGPTMGLFVVGIDSSTPWQPLFENLTFGMWCPEAAQSSPGAGSSALAATNLPANSNLSPGSRIDQVLIANGDPAIPGSTYGLDPVQLSDGLNGAPSWTIGTLMCTECEAEPDCQVPPRACCRNCDGNAYTFDPRATSFDVEGSPSALGFASDTDLHLLPGTLAYPGGTTHTGARYAGTFSYSQTMLDMGIPSTWLLQRAVATDLPDPSSMPSFYQSLIPWCGPDGISNNPATPGAACCQECAGCGIGPELAVVAPLLILAWLHSRRRRTA